MNTAPVMALPHQDAEREIGNIEAEQALLGAIMVDQAVMDGIGGIKPEDFFEEIHRRIFRIALDLRDSEKVVTPITILPYLPAGDKIGNMTVGQYVVRLASEAITTINAPAYAQAVVEASIARQASSLAGELADEIPRVVRGASVVKMLASAQERLEMMRERMTLSKVETSPADAFYAAISRTPETVEAGSIPFALPEMRAVLSEPGFTVGNLYGLLARSGEGKSSLTVQIMRHALGQGHPVLFLSYDQSVEQTTLQMAQQIHEIEMRRVLERDIGAKEMGLLADFHSWLRKQPFSFVKCHDDGVIQIDRHVGRFIARLPQGHKAPLVVVDHIKAVRLSREVQNADAGTKAGAVARPMKTVAGKHGCAVLLLNQRNSKGLARYNPRPIAADLHGGEESRYDYDSILSLYRPWVWMQEQESTSDKSSGTNDRLARVFANVTEETAELSGLKVRFGPQGIRRNVRFEGRFTRFHSGRISDEDARLL